MKFYTTKEHAALNYAQQQNYNFLNKRKKKDKYFKKVLLYSSIVVSLLFLQIWQANNMQSLLNEYTEVLTEKEWIESTHKKLLMEYCSLTSLIRMGEKFKEAGFVIPTLEDVITITSTTLISTQTQQERFPSTQVLASVRER